LSLGIHTDMLHLPAAVSDEAGAGPQLDGLTDRFNRFRLADLAGRHLGMLTFKRERSPRIHRLRGLWESAGR
ncbi:MAG: hypothetical protein ACLPH3_09740, partial [Terracidiphilus sp.]